MKKRVWQITAFLLAVLMLATLLAGCKGKKNDYEIDYDIDLTQKPKLNVLMPYSGRSIADVNSDATASLIREITGLTCSTRSCRRWTAPRRSTTSSWTSAAIR